ncbi:hypothetical protein KAFR_0I00460 [Kazachstania africana CBS 2517]|uniref:Uncharacterized protein n=1 Tax=Kazachstania africana (strain ATCC 22294 / BCRC 22015 / CBS 2517 / CECT 1963 / NBRC 1671 / NRRL Y-8276) TaxID=1071382 RepID=H2AZM7_KAZAF|nr:hypothetical protein KAFR_0I00460 [Kazachstania africana CBS 2517]CCF59827.1 hypothetical protein KAFR_0I00460 [Kazachstania africana CBS 2517]
MLSAEEKSKLANMDLYDMTIDQQKDLYADDHILVPYFNNLATRTRNAVSNGYLLPKELVEEREAQKKAAANKA